MATKFVVASEIACELMSVLEMLSEIGITPELSKLMLVDNEAAFRKI